MEKEAPGLMKEAEKFLILTNIDRLWKEHLQALKFVQQAVGLRGYAQRDPLIEYKLEGYNLFVNMMARIRRNVIYSIYQVLLVNCHSILGCSSSSLLTQANVDHFFQFQPVLVKDQKNRERQKEVKLDANGNSNPDTAISSSSAVGQEATK